MTTKNLIASLVLLLIGAAAGYSLPRNPSAAHPGTVASSMHMEDSRYDVPAGEPTPSVHMEIFPDSVSGWNLHFITNDFSFDPAHAGGDDVAGHGHIHLLVDGTKVARVYGDWFHLDPLPAGKHTITAELRTNGHEAYYVNGMQVIATSSITQATAGTTASNTKTFNLTVKDGKVIAGSGDITVSQGDTVALTVTNDKDEEVHLHGYNKMMDVKAGVPGTITFLASASGRFPFELEDEKIELGAISVMPQ